MTQETKRPRIIIDTNKHGIRREINLDALANKAKKKQEKRDRRLKKDII